MIDILVVYSCTQDTLTSLERVSNYDDMKAYFVHRSFRKIDHNLNIQHVCIPEIFNNDDFKNPDIEYKFKKVLADHGVSLGLIKNILFAKLKFRAIEYSMRSVLNAIPGRMYKFEDKNIKLSNNDRIQTIGHYIDVGATNNFFEAGLTVAHDVFEPVTTKDKVLRVHIDHNLELRKECFKEIKGIVSDMQSKIASHPHWDSLEIIYHAQTELLDNIGHHNYSNVPLPNIAKLYGKTDIAFISHSETLGMYHLEQLSAGSTVCMLGPKLLKKEVIDGLPIIKNVRTDTLLDPGYLMSRRMRNRRSVEKFSFDNYVKRIVKFISNR